MTTDQKNIVLATVPFLKENGVQLTTYFYNRMFQHHPELKNLFNMGNQRQGKQQHALAGAVLAYAENINDPSVLLPVIDRIGQKHTSLGITAEQYDIVGEHLLSSIAEVLGDAATTEILDAWKAAYLQLAAVMSGYEAQLYQQQREIPHSWNGWRAFRVGKRVMESDEICSFYLYPVDGGKVPAHQPGQYISLKLFLPSVDLTQIRQYSLSDTPNNDYFRISVKKETGPSVDTYGMISNQLHAAALEGTEVMLSAPAGSFIMPADLRQPVMFISGGVGVTPFVSMLQHLLQQDHQAAVTWLHGCRNSSVHAFKAFINEQAQQNEQLKQYTFYNTATPDETKEGIYTGHLDIQRIAALEHTADTLYYVCGPGPFIEKQVRDLRALGVDKGRIFFEEFGPQLLQLN
jgi:nitric oxide dioxygenase